MKVNNKHYHTIWVHEKDPEIIQIIDQRHLPHEFLIEDLSSVEQVALAIKEMHVRGAGLIGVTAAYGMYLATLQAQKSGSFEKDIQEAAEALKSTRPTAVNLFWAVDKQLKAISHASSVQEKIGTALKTANEIAKQDMQNCKKIGEHGLKIIEQLSKEKKGEAVNILTHCNAGWLGFVDYGSASAPIYAAAEKGIKIQVWVDETRPRNQGSRLTAWELHHQGVPHTIIPDSVGGHLMQNGLVDMVIVGSDRTTYTGDVANKIGTYLKALAAKDNDIPFYVALPSSTFDWTIRDGVKNIPIEQRSDEEVKYIHGLHEGKTRRILVGNEQSKAANYAFDVTPARLISGLITERGVCKADENSILDLFAEHKR